MSLNTEVNASPEAQPLTRGIPRLRVPKKLRNLELALLIFACAINACAVVLVQLGALGHTDITVITYAAVPAALVVGMHIALRFVAPGADPFLLPIATLLTGLGIAEIYRIDLHYGVTGFHADGIKQIMWAAIAIACALGVIIGIRNHRVLQRYTYLFGFAALLLLLLPMAPGIGKSVYGARVWIGIGPLSFQPGEIAKLCLAVFFAGYLVRARESLSSAGRKVLGIQLPRARDLGPLVVMWLASMTVIILQHDLGTGLLMFGLFLVMLYVATGRTGWVVLGALLILGGGLVASKALPYVHDRFANWLTPFSEQVYNRQGGSFQLVQGIFGLAQGGLIGTGLGQGQPWITPVARSDYIIASLGEELGLIGLFAIFALYLVFVARGIRIGFAGHDDFGKLLAVGLSFTIGLQTFIVIGGVTRVIPLTGLTTPFLAAGGSSLVANWIIVGLLLRLSDSIRNQPQLVVG